MKKILSAYALVLTALVLTCLLFSYGSGLGYVYLFFRGWELQTNVLVLVILLCTASLLFQVVWYLAKRYLSRRHRRTQQVISFETLHPYEKLAVLWLLDADIEKEQMIQDIFSQSALLDTLIKASFLRKKGEYDAVYPLLEQTPPAAYELAELHYIETLILDHQQDQALLRLEKLSNHQPASWLLSLQHGYTQYIAKLWGQFAIQFPWAYLNATTYGNLTPEDNHQWLITILQTFDHASTEERDQLKARYLGLEQQMAEAVYSNKVLWLKILARFPELAIEHELLVTHLLEDRFDQDVFFMWFEQKILCEHPNYADIEQQIEIWQDRYMPMPVFSFTKYCVYEATGRIDDANSILQEFPNHVLMNYLRIKANIKNDNHLVEQLNQIFETDTKFLKINI